MNFKKGLFSFLSTVLFAPTVFASAYPGEFYVQQVSTVFKGPAVFARVSSGALSPVLVIGYKRNGVLSSESNQSLDAVVIGSCGKDSSKQTVIKLGREWHGTGYMNEPVGIASLLPSDCQSVQGQKFSVAFSDGKGGWDSIYGKNYQVTVEELWSRPYPTRDSGSTVGSDAWYVIINSMY